MGAAVAEEDEGADGMVEVAVCGLKADDLSAQATDSSADELPDVRLVLSVVCAGLKELELLLLLLVLMSVREDVEGALLSLLIGASGMVMTVAVGAVAEAEAEVAGEADEDDDDEAEKTGGATAFINSLKTGAGVEDEEEEDEEDEEMWAE